MTKKNFFIFTLIICITVILAFPSLVTRIGYENNNKTIICSVNTEKFYTKFEYDKFMNILADFKNAGVSSAMIYNDEAITADKNAASFDIAVLNAVKKAGLTPVLGLCISEYANEKFCASLDKIIKEYNIEFLEIKCEDEKKPAFPNGDSSFLCKVIENNSLCVVLSESATQLSNEKPSGYEDYIEAANGSLMRSYRSKEKTTVKNKNYNLVYHELLNSMTDRGINFFVINMLSDTEFDNNKNADRTLEATRMFMAKAASSGYKVGVKADFRGYNNYTGKNACTAAIFDMILCAAVMLEQIFEKNNKKVTFAALILALLAAAAAYFIIPQSVLMYISTLFAAFAPCFAITETVLFINKYRDKKSFPVLLLSSGAIMLAVLCFSGALLASMFGGLLYHYNSYIFRGVKFALLFPMVYTCAFMVIIALRDKNKYGGKKLKIKPYHIAGVLLILGVVFIYIRRSGNIMKISSLEVYFRNFISEIMVVRPRTKEYIFGHPAFVLFVYYSKYGKSRFTKAIFAFPSSILFASVINSFCHVYASVSVIYMRVLNGLILGICTSCMALLLNMLIRKAVIRKK